MKKIITLLIMLNIIQQFCFSQKQGEAKTDSLLTILKTLKEDTNKANALNKLSEAYSGNDPGKAMDYARQTLELSEKINYKKGIGNAYNSMGWITAQKGEDLQALEYYKKALTIREDINDKTGIATTYGNIGGIYMFKGDYPEALKDFFGALKIQEETGDKQGIATSYHDIGMIYSDQGNFTEALKNLFASLKIREKINDKQEIASSYNAIGGAYYNMHNFAEALKDFNEAMNMQKDIGDKTGIAIAYCNIGSVYTDDGKYAEALKNFFAGLKIFEEIGDKKGISYACITIGNTYSIQKKYDDASLYLNKGLEVSKEIGTLYNVKNSYDCLARLDSMQGKFAQSLKNYKLYIVYRDKMYNEENTRKTTKQQMQYEFYKKQVADSVKAGDEKKIISSELKQEQTKSYTLFGGVALLLVFGGFMFNRFKVTQKQRNTIEIKEKETQKQKTIIEEKQKEILDSIEYALRIQTAILPPQRIVKQYLENSFILYKPKDIVAGDFYWMEVSSENGERRTEKDTQLSTPFSVLPTPDSQLILFAACDCTGHGVPGAMVSVVCHNALNRAVREFGLTQPAAILDKTAEIVIENFSKSEEDIKDGMDISLVSLEFGERRAESSSENGERRTEKRDGQQTTSCILNYAGANNPLWIVKSSENGEWRAENSQLLTPNSVLTSPHSVLLETKADKQPIGMNEDKKPFTNHTFTLNSGDSIYLFTDGFADQFGGDTGQKKLTRKRFKELILSIQQKTMQEQGIALDKFITEYRKEVEQIDDILVMGVRV